MRTGGPVFASLLFLVNTIALGQLTPGPDLNLSQKPFDDWECAVGVNPANHDQLFVACNTSSPGLFAARSDDGGKTWVYPDPSDKTIADGNPAQGPAAWGDPSVAWDPFGNLFITYISMAKDAVVTILSVDGGRTFTKLASFQGSPDQPTIVASRTSTISPAAVWVVWNESGQMAARGAPVTGLGAVGKFNALQMIPGTADCSFGDVAIAPDGAVVQVCESPAGGQGPATLLVNTDPDGLGPLPFGSPVAATTTNVGGFDFFPAQTYGVDAEAGLAFDTDPGSPHFKRLYLVYTEETVQESNDFDIMLRFSDDKDHKQWSNPVHVNDDQPGSTQFLPRIAVDDSSGNILICWHDCRNSTTNTAMQEYCAMATPAGAVPSFAPNVLVGDAPSTLSNSVTFGSSAESVGD